jgi:putative hydrolase of the HAD superfamily
MQFYKHYCFDLWQTLIKPDPAFKDDRNCFFYHNLNFGGKPIEEVALIFREVDLMCSAINEKTGKIIDAGQMYLMVIDLLNDHLYPLNRINLDSLVDEMDSILLRHPPLLSSTAMPQLLYQLREPGHVTMSILGNTGFIRGTTLRTVLKKLEISDFFDFQLYCDEIGMIIHDPAQCDLIKDHIYQCSKARPTDVIEIVHVSENTAARGSISNAVTMRSLNRMAATS